MIVNSFAQRSFQDLTQYPVMPWVLADYSQEIIDFSSNTQFRDLSKPIGALGDSGRIQELRERYDSIPEDEPRFLYGSHYSCPGYVIGYHLRKNPNWMLKFQSGRFDNSDRLFHNIAEEWSTCMTNRQTFKELIPEFYLPGMESVFAN